MSIIFLKKFFFKFHKHRAKVMHEIAETLLQRCRWHSILNAVNLKNFGTNPQYPNPVSLMWIWEAKTPDMIRKKSWYKDLYPSNFVSWFHWNVSRNTRTIFALWNNYHIFSSSFNHNINEYRITPAAKEDTSHHTSVWYFFFCPLWKMLFLSNFCTIQFLQPNQFKMEYLPICKSRFE